MRHFRRDLRRRRFRAVLRIVAGILLRWATLGVLCMLAFRYLPAIGAWVVLGVACIFCIGDVAWQILANLEKVFDGPLNNVSNMPHFVPWTPRRKRATQEQYEYLASKGWRGKRDLNVGHALELMFKYLSVELGYAYLEKHGPAIKAYKEEREFGESAVPPILLEYRDEDGPATDRQICFLESKGIPISRNLTMGEASELTTEWAHKEFAPEVWKMMYGSKSNAD